MELNTLADWLAWLERLHPSEIDLGLERIAQVAERLQLTPGKACVITVAGTNGKGSTLAYLESILLQANYRVAKYTSPHLIRFNERVCINGQPVSDRDLCGAFAQVEQARADTSLTYFEFTTLAALLLFQQAGMDVWLLEVGLGGRLDAVNIIDSDCALITNIALDHTDWLGDTREQIGYEKAGILRAGRPALFGDLDLPATVQQRADELGTRLLCCGRDYDCETQAEQWLLRYPSGEQVALPLPGLPGTHQMRNAALACMALEQLKARLPVTAQQLAQGIATARLPGRFQRIPGEVERLFDVAHNPAGATALANFLADNPAPGRTLAIFSALSDKDVAGMVEPLQPMVDEWYITGTYASRGQSAQQIGAQLQGMTIHEYAHGREAWQAAGTAAQPGDRILIYGSFYLVGDLLEEVEHGRAD